MKGSNYIYNDFSHTTVCSVWDKGYRYGFNSMEKDNEINVDGGSYDFGARIYDSRLGRFLSIDPLHRNYNDLSSYSFAFNSPILFVDLLGEKGTVYIQVILDKQGKPVIDKKTMKAVVKDMKETYNKLGVDIKVKVNYSNDIMTKDNFYKRKNADPTDSYVIAANEDQLKEIHSNKTEENKGWEDVPEIVQPSGISGVSASNDQFSFINADKVKIKENYDNIISKISIVIQHETGHPKFKGHPRNSNRFGPTNVACGHISGTIMQEQPNSRVEYDFYLVNRLREIHGTTKDAKPIAERKTEFTFEDTIKKTHNYSGNSNKVETLYLKPTNEK
jgi:RHS repeat-associated protein